MFLSSLNITNFRIFGELQLEFEDGSNIFYGENGSGKTSLLEAIYYLALGRSFRSHILSRIIQSGSDSFSLFGKIKQENSAITVGITKSTVTGKRIKIAGKEISSNIELTKILPLQLLNHNSYSLLYDGSKLRRQFIDWGLFHVEQSFLALWRKVERILEQRNFAIRTKNSIDCIKIWDKELALSGFELHQYREKYIREFTALTQKLLPDLLQDFPISIQYAPGWDTNFDLEQALNNSLKQDLRFGYTTTGPHRADLKLLVGKIPAKDALSRGQQKVLLYGLQIAQGILLNNITDKKCIYLVDDLLAELDQQKCQLLANALLNLENTQLFITGLVEQDLKNIFNNQLDNKKIRCINQGMVR